MVTAILLLAFAYAFLILGRVAENVNGRRGETIIDAYMFTLEGFFNGPQQTKEIIDILFGIVAVIILLNVVIAIVSNAWDTAVSNVGTVFWEFRLMYLAHSETIFHPVEQLLLKHLGADGKSSFLRWIDNQKDIKFRDDVVWTEPPFFHIGNIHHYLHPEELFTAEDAEKLKSLHSFEGEMFWTVRECKSRLSRVKAMYLVSIKWFWNATVYAFLIALGIPCLGGFLASTISAGCVWKQL